jgi:hypothetical protein
VSVACMLHNALNIVYVSLVCDVCSIRLSLFVHCMHEICMLRSLRVMRVTFIRSCHDHV